MKIINIIKEEIGLFEQEQVYNLQSLAHFVAQNETNDPEMQQIYEPIYLEALQKAFQSKGDEGVVEAFKEMWGSEIYPISKGRYSFAQLYGQHY
jgi:hypothetical protein